MAKKAVEPIMSEDAERFMAFAGVIQWAYAVVEQGKRIEAAVGERIGARGGNRAIALRSQIQTECHLFVIAAWQLIKHREWAGRLGLFEAVDFRDLDGFSQDNIRDLRNMREHVDEYFQGAGNNKDRWRVQTPEYSADASSLVDTMIGGRLDWTLFSGAVGRLMPALLNAPVPAVAAFRLPT